MTPTFLQFTPADMQSAIAPAKTPPPPPVPNESRPTFGSSQSPAPPVPSGSKPKGMQLGSHKAGLGSSGVLPGGLAEESRWDGDLMDVNADADDWSTYPTLRS
jgi:SCY1-like protein 1